MGLLEIVLGGMAGLGIVTAIHESRKSAREEAIRNNTICDFSDGITEEEFADIIRIITKPIKRVRALHLDGPKIYGTAISQSGLTEWDFVIDFNDYGHLSGKYWIYSDNDDSKIPEVIAERVSQEIKEKK